MLTIPKEVVVRNPSSRPPAADDPIGKEGADVFVDLKTRNIVSFVVIEAL